MDQGITAVLRVDGLTAGYGGRAVLRNVSFTATVGEVTLIVGRNGSGKSTLLRAVMGLLPQRTGVVEFSGRPLDGPTHRLRGRGVAFVPQRRPVFESLTVEANLVLAAPTRVRDPLKVAASRFGWLTAKRKTRACLLSGGERQQLALACALASSPRLLLADEPAAGLSPAVRTDVLRQVAELAHGEGLAVVVVEHNVRHAAQVADRIVGLRMGEVVLDVPADEFGIQEQRLVFLE